MDYTKKLANYAVDLKYHHLPGEVIEQAKLLTLHTVGVGLASNATPQGRRAVALAKDMWGEKTESTVWGDGIRLPCMGAAFCNGTLADILDWEDCSWTGHPSANAIPAGLAVAEKLGSSGMDYITAVVAGYEVYQRIAMAVQPSPNWDIFQRGWGLTSWEIFAAAIPTAKLLNADQDKMAKTIGVAGVLSAISNSKYHTSMSDMYHYQHGAACMNGVLSASISESGITGLSDMLDGDNGYWISISDACDWDWFTKGLGEDYLIMKTLFKYWPANMWNQAPLDIVDSLVREYGIANEMISEIIVSPEIEYRMALRPEGYKGILDAQFNIPYCVAILLLDPEPGPNWFAQERLNDPKILETASKVRATGPVQKLMDSFRLMQTGSFPEVTVRIILKDGKQFTRSLKFPKGHPKNRLTNEEYKNRFRRAASFALDPQVSEKLIEKILNLENLVDISEITQLTGGSRR